MMIENVFRDSAVLSVVVLHVGRLTSFSEAQHTLRRFPGRPQMKDNVCVCLRTFIPPSSIRKLCKAWNNLRVTVINYKF